MSVYTYLFNLINAAAKEAKQLRNVDEDQLHWMYVQLNTAILNAERDGMVSTYQRKLLNSRLAAVWGAPDSVDNGY